MVVERASIVVGVEVFGPTQLLGDHEPSAISIGAFDGLHIGHRRLLGRLVEVAQSGGLRSVAVTFDRHPATILRSSTSPRMLTDLDLKLSLFEETGIDEVTIIAFDEQRSKESAEEFVEEIVVSALNAKAVVVGENFRFGHGRRGDLALLAEMGRVRGFSVEGYTLRGDTRGAISATRIRELIAAGEVALAAELLARAHRVRGVVVQGDRRGGSQLGFPTANVDVASDVAVPGIGIYAGWYRRPDGSRHAAAISVGRRPTFYKDGAPELLEAHLLDFTANLYGEVGDVAFVERLRDEVRYESVDALISQIKRDVAATREVLGV